MCKKANIDCDLWMCANNYNFECEAEAHEVGLLPNDTDCFYYTMEPSEEYIIKEESDIQEFLSDVTRHNDFFDTDVIQYSEIDKGNRLVYMDLAFNIRGKFEKRKAVFRINKNDQKQYKFYPDVDGGIGFIHKSIAESDLFTETDV